MSRERTRALARWARRLLVEPPGEPSVPVVWSMIDEACEERALALEYALASAPVRLEEHAPIMRAVELTAQRLTELAIRARGWIGTIRMAGPLATEQTLVLPAGVALSEDKQSFAWAYHVGVVLNVEGTLGVMDLSVGDETLPIDAWVGAFLSPPLDCRLVGDHEFEEVSAHYDWVLDGFSSGEPIERGCVLAISPAFTSQWDQVPGDRAPFIADVPRVLGQRTQAFAHRDQLAGSQASLSLLWSQVTSTYQPLRVYFRPSRASRSLAPSATRR